MKAEATSTCQACGARVPAGLDFCPVCALLRAGGHDSAPSAALNPVTDPEHSSGETQPASAVRTELCHTIRGSLLPRAHDLVSVLGVDFFEAKVFRFDQCVSAVLFQNLPDLHRVCLSSKQAAASCWQAQHAISNCAQHVRCCSHRA